MAIKAVFQGHWRALEIKWLQHLKLESVAKANEIHKIAVIVAGQPLSKHLLKKVDFTATGITFFPGIPKLAEALASTVAINKIPFSNCIALAALAGCKTENLSASAKFFEKMLEMGVTAEIFSIVIQSIRNIHKKVTETSRLFTKYSESRKNYYPSASSDIMEYGPKNPKRFQLYIFYGFYDLNPAQRKYIELLATDAEILWFSPLHTSHNFAAPFFRTSNLLSKLSSYPAKRVDLTKEFTQIAQFGNNLLTQKALLTNNSIELIRCGSGIGFTKAVTQCIKNNLHSCKTNEITVIASGEDAKQIATQLFIAGIPSTASFNILASHLPAGAFLKKLLELPQNRYHHKDIEKLLLSGFIKIENTPDAVAYAKHANKAGARFGLKALQTTCYQFAFELVDFFNTLPDKSTPATYLNKIKLLLQKLSCDTLPVVFSSEILADSSFSTSNEITYEIFIKMIDAVLETPICLTETDKEGISILPLEKARGISSKVIITTGMEEGLFPRPGIGDPRLPPEVKKLLQLPSLDTKETEDAYLLSQLFEAAREKLFFISRDTDTKGKPLALSHFIQPLATEKNLIKTTTFSDSPLNILDIPSNPPFLESSLKAQKERLFFDPDNPSPDAEHCSMIGSGLYKIDHITATALENYLYNPYNFLLDKIWDVHEEEEFPIRSEPPSLERGKIVHKCVEEALKTSSPVNRIIDSICLQNKLVELLGSTTLATIWKEHLTKGIKTLKDQILEREWTLIETEKNLKGTIAGFSATGKVDLIFIDKENNYILADLKTGKPKKVRNTRKITVLKNNLLQLPFYRNLALQNNYKPLSLALYIHLEGDGNITFVPLTDIELESLNDEFEDKVRETVQSMLSGDFHKPVEKRHNK